MLKVTKYKLDEKEWKNLKDASTISCPDLWSHECEACPMFVNVNKGYPKEEYRCLLTLIDQALDNALWGFNYETTKN